MQITRHDPADAPPLTQFVSGVARPRLIVSGEESEELRVFLVRFEPGGRNLFHTHTFDQAIFIVDGVAIVATEDEERQVVAGDFVLFPAGERHWHGAPADSSCTQLAFGIPGSSDFDGEAYTASE